MRIDRCNNIGDFRSMARRRLPGPIFHYIDGAADDEVTYRRNTEACERYDLVPNVLAGVESIDMSITVMGQKIDMPLFCAPTALQRLLHHDSEGAVAKAAEKFGTMFGISSLGTISIEEISSGAGQIRPLQPSISAPPVILQSTHEAALDVVDLADLKHRALELS